MLTTTMTMMRMELYPNTDICWRGDNYDYDDDDDDDDDADYTLTLIYVGG